MELAEFIQNKVPGLHSPLAYDLFNEVVVSAIPQFKYVSTEDASKAVVKALAEMGIEVGSQETNLHRKWPAQEHVVPFGIGNPGGLYNPVSSLKPGDFVSVGKDTWRPAFEGFVEKIKDGKVDVRDQETDEVQEDILQSLIKVPVAKGRPIAPPQHRRVGDPLGMMDGPLDNGDPNSKREYPGTFFIPKGHEGETASYPDLFYSGLINSIEEKHGKVSLAVAKYLCGEAVNLTSNLETILVSYGLLRAL